MSNPAQAFTCLFCGEDKNEAPFWINPAEDTMGEYVVCGECAVEEIAPLFEAAFKSSESYPPMW
jgi:transcription elongation factor Elf1